MYISTAHLCHFCFNKSHHQKAADYEAKPTTSEVFHVFCISLPRCFLLRMLQFYSVPVNTQFLVMATVPGNVDCCYPRCFKSLFVISSFREMRVMWTALAEHFDPVILNGRHNLTDTWSRVVSWDSLASLKTKQSFRNFNIFIINNTGC